MGWGKGWEVGINREIWKQKKAVERAAEILKEEHGQRHQPGTRKDLCPLCQKKAPDRRGCETRRSGSALQETEKTMEETEKPLEEIILEWMEKQSIVAVLSTTVLPLDGTYKVVTLPAGEVPDLTGIPHYVGHPDTKGIIEAAGAVPAPVKLFTGLQIGEAALCVPIAQGKSARDSGSGTLPNQAVTLADLSLRVLTRLE